ncbi:hypothetical protein, partial [Singulisphaera acidiphila]|uniref:hypothetical protein n=1 Tax=Singulisphaera acidiphila TaxID=466153 RepID=UPI001ED8D054
MRLPLSVGAERKEARPLDAAAATPRKKRHRKPAVPFPNLADAAKGEALRDVAVVSLAHPSQAVPFPRPSGAEAAVHRGAAT